MKNSTPTHHVTIKKLPHSQIEITAIIPADEFEKNRTEAIKHIGKDVELPGFRKGHVPEKMLVAKIGEGLIMEEMAEMAIARAYPQILIAEKIDALGRPEVRITKIAPANPLEFTLITAVLPEVILPDHMKIAATLAKKKEEVVVTEDEITKTIDQIRKMRAQNIAEQDGKEFDEKAELPTIDDEFVKTLGNFDSVEAFTAQLKENITKEKERDIRDKKRVAIMEALIAETTLELPQIIIDQELHRMEDEFAQQISRMGMDIESYFKAVGKLREDMHKEWLPDAEKRAKVQLITSKIAEVEGLSPDKDTFEKEAATLREQYPDVPQERIEGYLEMLLTNEQVFQFLEAGGEIEKK